MAILDFSGITFADAAGAREVVQVREWSSSGKAPSHPSQTLDLDLTPLFDSCSSLGGARMMGSTFSWLSVTVRRVQNRGFGGGGLTGHL